MNGSEASPEYPATVALTDEDREELRAHWLAGGGRGEPLYAVVERILTRHAAGLLAVPDRRDLPAADGLREAVEALHHPVPDPEGRPGVVWCSCAGGSEEHPYYGYDDCPTVAALAAHPAQPLPAADGCPITCAHDGTYHDWDPDSGACPDPREFNVAAHPTPSESIEHVTDAEPMTPEGADMYRRAGVVTADEAGVVARVEEERDAANERCEFLLKQVKDQAQTIADLRAAR